VEGVKGVDATHAASTEKLNRETINTTVCAFVAAKFAFAVSGHSPAFESDKFFKE